MTFSNIKKSDLINLLHRFLPILVWLPQYNLIKLRGDIIAGITCGFVVIPQSIAFANLGKLPAQNGLYASLTPGLIYAIFGTSKDVSVGTAVTLGLYTSSFNSTHSTIGASLLSFLSGIILVLMGLLKLGYMIKYVPQLVISAFVSATAITIMATQLSNLFGIKKAPQNVFEILKFIIVNVKRTNKWDLIMGIFCLAFLLFFVWLSSRKLDNEKQNKVRLFVVKLIWILSASRMVLVCFLATTVVYIFHVNGFREKFSTAGIIPKGLPKYQSPFQPYKDGNVTVKTTGQLIEGFGASLIILPIIMFIEQMSITKAFAKKFNYKVKAQQELIAIGMCNIIASFYGGWIVGGGFSRSAVNSMSGAQTPLAGAISGLIALIALEFMTPALYYIPSAALGAMMVMAVVTMIEMSIPKHIWSLHKWDLLPFFAAFFTSFYKLEYGAIVGTGIAILALLSREARPKYLLERNEAEKYIKLLLLENLTYPGVEAVNKTIYSEVNNCTWIETLFLDMSAMVRVDFTILKNFEFLKSEFSKKNILLCFINFSCTSVQKKFLKAGLINVGEDLTITKNSLANTVMMIANDKPFIETKTTKYLKTGLTEDDDLELNTNNLGTASTNEEYNLNHSKIDCYLLSKYV
ncbi:sodium-independent sulfate anion transporter isoform X1 [Hydra vulgaris]|uniref:sodium-independent sulfate anion transporter isoform X1 n=1 Tax=Hydra vulgaris TaxID=6087 RepID=UPI0032EA380D